jgi:hypothetical protein
MTLRSWNFWPKAEKVTKMNILQLVESEVSTQVAILPLIEAEITNLATAIPAVAQTKPVNFKVGSHVFSFVGVFTKVS